MASESSSAVLDLNDGDETEATTVTEDTHEGTPLIMEHGYDIAVKVDAPMKQLSTLETFVTYRVRCVCARWPSPPHVRRRYNHFKVLHRRLAQCHPLLAPPALPPLHSARQQLDRYSPSFVAVRTMALDAFLDRVAKHPILTHSADFRIFLTTPDEELDKVFKSDNSAMNLWGLSTALYGSGEAKVVNGARVKDPEFSSAAEYLQSLQHKLAALCALSGKLHKGTAALGAQLASMKRACDAWATQAGGRTARAAAACAAGAGAGAGACAGAGAGGVRVRTELAARLPLLAAYAAAHVDKIKQRDAIHATYISGINTNDELHNRLEQASEALRSELSDWMPKTHADIKSLLLQLAERQVSLHTQTLLGWEHALKLSTDANIDEIFKTVSKTAVQNLSPSRCRSVNETERDMDEFSEEFDVSNDFETSDDVLRLKNGYVKTVGKEVEIVAGNDKTVADDVETVPSNIENVITENLGTNDEPLLSKAVNLVIDDNSFEGIDESFESVKNSAQNKKIDESCDKKIDNKQNSRDKQVNIIKADEKVQGVSENVHKIQAVSSDDFLNEILEDGPSNNEASKDNSEASKNDREASKNCSDVIRDPLREFSDVDLS